MFDRRRVVGRSAVILLMFSYHGYALADDTNEYLSKIHIDLRVVDGSETSAANPGDIKVNAGIGGDYADVIEEIVVVGKQKWLLPNLSSSLGTESGLKKPRRIDRQFLPPFDPEQADRYFDLLQFDEDIRLAGFVELFRFRLGRNP